MALRMVLVSLVASLGLSLPSSDDVNRWTKSTQSWFSDHLAAWDARMPSGKEAFVYYGEIDDRIALGETPTSEIATAPSAERKVAPAELSGVFADAVPAKEEPKAELAAAEMISDEAFATVMTDVVAVFAADIEETNRKDLAAKEAVQPVVAEAAAAEPIVDEISDALANDMAAMFEAESKSLVVASETASPTFEPLIVAENLYQDFACDLRSGPENHDRPNPIVETAKSEVRPAASDRLGVAFRLTREAALAWANLLHAPAVVTIGH